MPCHSTVCQTAEDHCWIISVSTGEVLGVADNDWATMALRLEELAREFTDAHDVDTTLEGTLRVATRLAPCDVASVSIRRDGDIETTAATDPVAERVHVDQMEIGEGPCLEAEWDEAGLHTVEDLTDESRWPRWSRIARELGLRSLLAVRLFAREDAVGALDLYSYTPQHYDEDDIVTARMIAERVSASLAHARQEEVLWEAIDARHEIGQAQGILMQRYDVGADTAFAVIRRYAQQHGRGLREVAAEIIEQRSRPDRS